MKLLILVKNYNKIFDLKNINFKLSPDRETRANIFDSEEKQKSFILAEKITADAICKTFCLDNIEICGKVGEKPYLKNFKNICFSRSYDENILFLGIEDAELIGVDCEKIKNVDYNLMKYFFTTNERIFVENSENKDFAFTLIWTRKECYIKYLGRGLEFSFDLLDTTPKSCFQINLLNKPLFKQNDKINDLYINSFLIDDIVVSVCSKVNDEFPNVIKEGW